MDREMYSRADARLLTDIGCVRPDDIEDLGILP